MPMSLAAICLLAQIVVSGTLPPPADEARGRPWESGQSATLSADGRWFACTISAGSERSRMVVRDTDGQRRPWELTGASEPAFAADSKTLIYISTSSSGFEYVVRDIEAARAAGMDSGAVAWGYALPSALQAAGPTHLFNSIDEMMQRLTMTK